MTDAPSENCRQRLMNEGKAYPKSSCAVCGPLSPQWKECNAKLVGAADPVYEAIPVTTATTTPALSPSEVFEAAKKRKAENIPDFVIHAVNMLLIENYIGGKLFVKQDIVIDAVLKYSPGLTRDEIFDKKMLDFEEIFNQNGWVVTHHKEFRGISQFSFEAK